MHKIKRVSFWFRMLFQLLFIMLPIIYIVGWLNAPNPLQAGISPVFDVIPDSYRHGHVYAYGEPAKPALLHTLTPLEKGLGFTDSLIPLSVALFILYFLIRLFRHYEHGDIFSLHNVKMLRNIGYAIIIGELLNPFYLFFMGIILTMHNPPGHRYAQITIANNNLGMIVTGCLIILISWVMTEAYKLREEQQLTI